MGSSNDQWMKEWEKRVNEDKVLGVIGKYFTAEFYLGIGDTGYLISVRNGKIERLTDKMPDLPQCQFAIRAPKEAWMKFRERIPPPLYNCIFAMARQGILQIEGDTKVFWQNIRALIWMVDLMRTATN